MAKLGSIYVNFSISTPTQEPLSVDDVKDDLGINTTDHDAKLRRYIVEGRNLAEKTLGRALITQTITYKIDEFPYDDEIYLPRPPLISVTSVSYIDSTGTTQTFTNYSTDTTSQPGRIYLNYGVDWPSTQDIENAITIVYQAGYGDASSIPQNILGGIMLYVQERFYQSDSKYAENAMNNLFGVEQVWHF